MHVKGLLARSHPGRRGIPPGQKNTAFFYLVNSQPREHGNVVKSTILTDLDERGNLAYRVDFRQLYATLFEGWFGLEQAESQGVLGGSFAPLPLLAEVPTAVAEGAGPAAFALEQNWPNPFNPGTQIRYSLRRAGQVRLRVFNAAGQELARLVEGRQAAGRYQVAFDGAGLASGVYFYQLEAEGLVARRKMVMQK